MINNEMDDDSFQDLFIKMSHLYFKKTYQQLADTGVHPGQIPMIKLLGESEGLSQRELSDRLHIKPPTVTVSLRRMERSGLIERIADVNDQRRIRIYLSEKGKSFNKKTHELVKTNEQYLFEGFTEGEVYLLKRFLQQLITNLEHIPIENELKE